MRKNTDIQQNNIFYIIAFLIAIYLIILAIQYILIPAIVIIISLGSLMGGGISFRNYFTSLKKNVYFEKPKIK